MPDEKEPPRPIVSRPPIDRTNVQDAVEPDPMSDEIERLQREAQPKPKLCPHCGKELPKE